MGGFALVSRSVQLRTIAPVQPSIEADERASARHVSPTMTEQTSMLPADAPRVSPSALRMVH